MPRRSTSSSAAQGHFQPGESDRTNEDQPDGFHGVVTWEGSFGSAAALRRESAARRGGLPTAMMACPGASFLGQGDVWALMRQPARRTGSAGRRSTGGAGSPRRTPPLRPSPSASVAVVVPLVVVRRRLPGSPPQHRHIVLLQRDRPPPSSSVPVVERRRRRASPSSSVPEVARRLVARRRLPGSPSWPVGCYRWTPSSG